MKRETDPGISYFGREVIIVLNGRRMNQIYQTMTVRLELGLSGPPDSYDPEEKEYYIRIERSTLDDRENGFQGVYFFPNDCD